MTCRLRISVWMLFGTFLLTPSLAFDPVEVFEKKCSSCHTIGGGEDVGPDLKGLSERRTEAWLIQFIQESQAMVNAGDPIAVDLFNKYRKKKMPDQDLSDDEVKQLLAFIKSGGAGLEQSPDAKSALKATVEEIARGEQLFAGHVPFQQGGPACIQCHIVGDLGALGGGTLGPNLTAAFSNYNDKGLSKVLTKISFPVMNEVYAGKALTAVEVFQIKSFLYEADKKGYEPKGERKKFVFMALIGLLLGFGVIDVSWRNRRKKSQRPLIGEDQ